MSGSQDAPATAHQASHIAAFGKTIAGTMIFSRFVGALGQPPTLDLTKPVSSILQGGLVAWDLGLKLMSYQEFKTDGLILNKSDVMNAVTLGNLCDLIYKWYSSNGWMVT